MGIEGKALETSGPEPRASDHSDEHLRRSRGLDAMIHGEEDLVEQATPEESDEAQDESQWETEGGSMARQVPDLITDVMNPG